MDDRDAPLCPLIDKTKVRDKVLPPEAVPSNLCEHSIEAWIEFPHRTQVEQCRCEVDDVWHDGGLTAAHSGARRTVRRAVEAMAVGVAASHIWVGITMNRPPDEPQSAAADDREAVACGRGDEWRALQAELAGFVIWCGGVRRETAVADGAVNSHLTTHQGDVDDLPLHQRSTNHRSWWFKGVVTCDAEVAAYVGCSAAIADSERVRDGHIATLVGAARQRYIMS